MRRCISEEWEGSETEVMKEAYAVLVLILAIQIPVYAQGEAELWNGDDIDDYLFLDLIMGEELWEPDPEPSCWEFCMDMDTFCDILLELCLDLEVEDEEVYEIFPELWEPDYGSDLYWEDEYIFMDF
jgi:hypothetical protein